MKAHPKRRIKRLTVGFNGDIELIPRLAEYDVESVFAKMTRDLTGGGRASFMLANMDFDHLKACREHSCPVREGGIFGEYF